MTKYVTMMKRFQKNEIRKKMKVMTATYGVPLCRLSRMLQNVRLVIIESLSISVLRQLKVMFSIRPEPLPEPVELKSNSSMVFRIIWREGGGGGGEREREREREREGGRKGEEREGGRKKRERNKTSLYYNFVNKLIIIP